MNPAPVWRKLSWLLLIWAASVLALGGVSFLFRLLMQLAGLHSH